MAAPLGSMPYMGMDLGEEDVIGNLKTFFTKEEFHEERATIVKGRTEINGVTGLRKRTYREYNMPCQL